ncbi:hypothetical protein HK102_002065 [Quaeritorhiza haematococci]|nr:hypothetical protein HK102_002065 [Quaeritorhiza haematococci]
MSETILRALNMGYFSLDSINSFDPSLMFAVPRLTIVSGLIHMPDCVNLTDADGGFRWFRMKATQLARIKEELNRLSKREVVQLEMMLTTNETEPAVPSLDAQRDCTCCLDSSSQHAVSTGVSAGGETEADRMDLDQLNTDLKNGSDAHAHSGRSTIHTPTTESSSQPRSATVLDLPKPDITVTLQCSADGPSLVDQGQDPCQRAQRLHSVQIDEYHLHHCPHHGMLGASTNPESNTVLLRLYREICSVADMLQSGPRAREFVGVLQKAFSMYEEKK